ncbi:MAG TPA: YbaY family lipoprotein [Vineibacter sp.]|nr:YbaY family lipoprotein [Vineibacter sp.]
MRRFAFVSALSAMTLATPTLGQEPGGISSGAISRCAGKIGTDTRQSDAAFGVIMLDGMPWVTIERTEQQMGAQMIATTVTGNGARRRRDGTSVPFRFTCVLDTKGQAVMFHTSQIVAGLGDALPAATVIAGTATYQEKVALPRGAELRVQLLDTAKAPAGEIMAEQVVRSGWQVPIPFALRLPKDTPLEGRKLVIAARLVAARQTLFQLKEAHAISGDDFRKPIELTLEKPAAAPTPARKR